MSRLHSERYSHLSIEEITERLARGDAPPGLLVEATRRVNASRTMSVSPAHLHHVTKANGRCRPREDAA